MVNGDRNEDLLGRIPKTTHDITLDSQRNCKRRRETVSRRVHVYNPKVGQNKETLLLKRENQWSEKMHLANNGYLWNILWVKERERKWERRKCRWKRIDSRKVRQAISVHQSRRHILERIEEKPILSGNKKVERERKWERRKCRWKRIDSRKHSSCLAVTSQE